MLSRVIKSVARAAPMQVRKCNGGGGDDVDIDAVAYGYMASQGLFAGLELGVFDKINKTGSMNLETLQKEVDISEPRLLTLLTALTAHKMLRRSADGLYTLSPNTARYLVEDSKYYYGDYLKFQIGRQFYKRLTDLGTIMATGEAPTYTSWFKNPEEARMYTMAQHNGSLATARQLKKKIDLGNVKRFLDVGGGSGAFSIVMARAYPELSATVLELPEVAETGKAIVAKEEPQVAERIQYKSGTALVDWPVTHGEHDVVLMSYLSGSVPASLIQPLYEQAFKALVPGGRLIVHDFMVNDSLDGPPIAALWALQHVAVNAEGLGLCPSNVSEYMRKAGFTVNPSFEMIGGLTKVVVAVKPGPKL